MNRLLPFALASFVVCRVFSQEGGSPQTVPDLQQSLQRLMAQERFEGALWGVKVVSLDSGKTLFEHNSHKLVSPASNSKLYTVALALDRLGVDYRIRTSLFSQAAPDRHGTLRGDLVVYGRGDPTINSRLHGGSIASALQPLVASLTNAGVKRVTGDLVADESFFRGPGFGSGWAWDDMQYYYGAEISALTINDNTLEVLVRPGARPGTPCELSLSPATPYIQLRNYTRTAGDEARRTISFYRPLNENSVYVSGQYPIGTNFFIEEITVHNPAKLFAFFFREALARQGVRVKGSVRTFGWLDQLQGSSECSRAVELGGMDSLALEDIAREVQKPSQNLYTDLLLAHVGERFRRPEDASTMTSEDLGIRELNKFLAEAGVPSGEVFFEEGSGLSRNNLTTANATVALLQYMARHKYAEAYIRALPVAGVDGTLRNRMKNTRAAGNLRGKTGSLRWASSLSGFVTTAAGERLAFSLMLNRYHSSSSPARAELDGIAVLLAQLQRRSDS